MLVTNSIIQQPWILQQNIIVCKLSSLKLHKTCTHKEMKVYSIYRAISVNILNDLQLEMSLLGNKVDHVLIKPGRSEFGKLKGKDEIRCMHTVIMQ